MLGWLYLFLCFSTGWAICTYAFPGLEEITETAYDNRKISVNPYLLLFPAWFLSGTLALTWSTYLIAVLFARTELSLAIANGMVLPIAFLGTAAVYYKKLRKQKNADGQVLQREINLITDKSNRTFYIEMLLLASITLLACILMWTTFFIKGDQLYIGATVFSDFSPHIGMIRSFSYGNNFPTAYTHFAGGDIKYHFMFQFLVGNLEFLGMRLDYAFNIPSVLSFISAFLLIYVLAVKITARISAGVLSCLFFAFRSSKSLFAYVAELPAGTNLWKALTQNSDFIASTPNEEWGLWNLNVYCNQRHFAFGLAGIFFVIILFLPHIYAMVDNIKQINSKGTELDENRPPSSFTNRVKKTFRLIFMTKEGWAIHDLRLCIASGFLLGSMAFFNGAAVIGGLLVLFMIAVLSRRRLEFLILALITIILSLLQTAFFIEGTAMKPEILFGFLAENKTIFGVASYLERLFGILPYVLIAALFLEKKLTRYLMLAFCVPLLFAFTVSLTPDIAVNHKYIMISSILLSIFAASLVANIMKFKGFLLRFTGIILIIMLTATGIYDFYTLLKKDTPQNAIVLELKSPLTSWVKEHSDSKDIFLTSNYSINQVVLGGAMLYQGWQYFAWSAGYDTDYRDRMVKKMYEAKTPDKLDALVKENKIRFIVIDNDTRVSEYYTVNEANIQAAYDCVYWEGEGDWKTSIYDTNLPLFD
jgi:hypothetical protein